jgi:poly(3-hydroxyoctanoate) depolymerase
METAPALAFLPGASGRGEFWSTVAGHFDDVASVTFDWPGFGDVPADPARALGCYDDLATMVIEQLTGPTVVIGQSMGGVVAAMVAKRRPDLVSHLVLAATSGGVDVASLGAVDWRPSSRAANPTNPSWISKLIPRARLVVFPCDDHWVARIHGDDVAREIRELLRTT